MDCKDFINQWEKLYAVKWGEIQEKINEVIKDVFETVSRYSCLAVFFEFLAFKSR